MRCPKCGLNSFDHNETCPGCGRNLAPTREMLGLISVAPQPVFFLGSLIQEEGQAASLVDEEAEDLGAYTGGEAGRPERIEEPGSLEEAGTLEFTAEEEAGEVAVEEEAGPSGEIEFEGSLAVEEEPSVEEELSIDLAEEKPAEEIVEGMGETAIDESADEVELEADEGQAPLDSGETLIFEADEVESEPVAPLRGEESGVELKLDEVDLDFGEEEPEPEAEIEAETTDEAIDFEEEELDLTDLELDEEEPSIEEDAPLEEDEEAADDLSLTDMDLEIGDEEEDLAEGEIDDLEMSGLDIDVGEEAETREGRPELEEEYEEIEQIDLEAETRIMNADEESDLAEGPEAAEDEDQDDFDLDFDDLEIEDDEDDK